MRGGESFPGRCPPPNPKNGRPAAATVQRRFLPAPIYCSAGGPEEKEAAAIRHPGIRRFILRNETDKIK